MSFSYGCQQAKKYFGFEQQFRKIQPYNELQGATSLLVSRVNVKDVIEKLIYKGISHLQDR
jgi:hypothetical protein